MDMSLLESKSLRVSGYVIAAAAAAWIVSGGPARTQTGSAPPPISTADEIEKFCGNIADAARDRRYAIQTKELESLKSEIDERVRQLEAKRAEYEKWMKLREDFVDKATENVVAIYSKMRPDAAAERLAELDSSLAAAIMLKLQVKQSGLIMTEMERATAAKLTAIMSSAARKEDPT